jgi:hypothetical protein
MTVEVLDGQNGHLNATHNRIQAHNYAHQLSRKYEREEAIECNQPYTIVLT